MYELNVTDYYKVVEPVKSLEINTLFAQTVLHHKLSGKVYVDNVIEPKTFYILHPYGMSLLFGEAHNEEFNRRLGQYLLNSRKERIKGEWLQVYPENWKILMDRLADSSMVEGGSSGKIIKHTRVNFQFSQERYEAIKPKLANDGIEIIKTTAEMFDKIQGAVIPKFFWKDGNDFETNGCGYSLICEGDIASTAFAGFILDGKLEIGIETSENFRGKGYAAMVCAKLIDYCLSRGLEPVWACRLENTASYMLAQKLGFIPTLEIPYYYIAT